VSAATTPPPATAEVTRHRTPDGRVAFVRPARPEDRARFIAAVNGLSPRTLYQRFFSPIPRLPARDVDRLMDLDGTHQVVLHATDEHGVAVVGVARFVFTGPREAELAITVAALLRSRGFRRTGPLGVTVSWFRPLAD
jgi:hypothetical protein